MSPFDPATAYTYGSVVEVAYRLFAPGLLAPTTSGVQLPAGWTVLTELTAVDRVGGRTEPEFFGLILQSAAGGVLVAIRGTDTFLEWLVDAEFAHRAFPGLAKAGLVEDGFCSVYSTLTCSSTGSDVATLLRQQPSSTRIIITGHSLGAAVATLLAVEVAATMQGVNLVLYTFASPRTGDATFVSFSTACVPEHYRIVNRPDLVPHVPPLYEPTGTEILLDSTKYPNIAHSVACYHTLTTYLWLLNQRSAFGLSKCRRAAPPAPMQSGAP